MVYFTNTELSDTYGLTYKTVSNWVKAAEAGKLDLAITKTNGKSYVTKNSGNIALIEQLVRERKKFRPHRSVKVLEPKPEFYKLFDHSQIFDIMTNLEVRHEIPREYNYFNGGAHRWDEYIQKMDVENVPSNLTMTRELMAKNQIVIDDLIKKYKKVNVIDLGVGNALPIKDFLGHLLAKGCMGRYIAIDISPDMLKIAERNINDWYDGKIKFEGYELDIGRDRFSKLTSEDFVKNESNHTCNLVLFIGGTLQNFRKRDIPLQVINDSMGADDFLVHTQKLDYEATRRQFDFTPNPGVARIPPIHSLMIELLGIDESLYDVDLGFDEEKRERFEKIIFKSSIAIKFNNGGSTHTINIDKGTRILLWRASQDKAIEITNQFYRNEFTLLQTSLTEDQQYILTISKVSHE